VCTFVCNVCSTKDKAVFKLVPFLKSIIQNKQENNAIEKKSLLAGSAAS